MLQKLSVIFFAILLTTLLSCSEKNKSADAQQKTDSLYKQKPVILSETRQKIDSLYNQTKAVILSESGIRPDSTQKLKPSSGIDSTILLFHKGVLTVKRKYYKGSLRVVVFYSRDGLFELRREIHQNGQIAFEGIFYKGDAYGLTTDWNYNGHMKSQGLRYKDNWIGVWATWDSTGQPTTKDYGNAQPIDSFPVIKPATRN